MQSTSTITLDDTLTMQLYEIEEENLEMTVLEAMAREEGFYAPGNDRPKKNNNPGDIEYGKFAKAHGAIGSDGRFAIFPTINAGWAAMRALLLSAYKGLTIKQALDKYAPPVENQTNVYLANVCKWANVQPTDLIDEHLG